MEVVHIDLEHELELFDRQVAESNREVQRAGCATSFARTAGGTHRTSCTRAGYPRGAHTESPH